MAADLRVYGGLEVVSIDPGSGLLRCQVRVFGVESDHASGLGLAGPLRELSQALGHGGLDALLSFVEIPVRFDDHLALPAVSWRRLRIPERRCRSGPTCRGEGLRRQAVGDARRAAVGAGGADGLGPRAGSPVSRARSLALLVAAGLAGGYAVSLSRGDSASRLRELRSLHDALHARLEQGVRRDPVAARACRIPASS